MSSHGAHLLITASLLMEEGQLCAASHVLKLADAELLTPRQRDTLCTLAEDGLARLRARKLAPARVLPFQREAPAG